MVKFGETENTVASYRLFEVNRFDTLGEIVQKFGPENWGDLPPGDGIGVKVSHSKSASYDKFSLNNTMDLVLRVLKSDVLWIKYEKTQPAKPPFPTKNAFQVLFTAQNQKTLPQKIPNPFNQKLTLFNGVIDMFDEQEVGFSVSDCSPRIRNKKIGNATQLVYDTADILWKVNLAEKALKNRSLWHRIPQQIKKMLDIENKSKDPVTVTQASIQNLVVLIREVADRAIFSHRNLVSLKLSLLTTADILTDLEEALRTNLERARANMEKQKLISSATEAVVQQISEREKVTVLRKGSRPVTHPILIQILKDLSSKEDYQPVNISNKLPTNRFSRSTFLHRTLPRQLPITMGLWSFENGGVAPQSMFVFTICKEDSQQLIFDKISDLKPELLAQQKMFFPKEFYHQFYDQAGSVTGVSKQNFKLLSAMVMGDDRKLPGDVQQRFQEAIFSADPELVYDLRFYNGREIEFNEFLAEFRSAVEEFMVEDRGRHEGRYDDTIISKVSFGFSLKSVFNDVCKRVKAKNPNCPIPKSESFLTRYLIPRTRAAAEAVSKSQPLIPLKLAMQQKVIEKPNCDAYYNAAMYKYLRSFAVELGKEQVTLIGWDDKTGVDCGEPEQPTAATQHPGKSWVSGNKVVAEGQHSFHKTNLTPSVRLLHEIPDDVNGSFFRGEPQVSIKDSIFEHSTSARHGAELLQMFNQRPELVRAVLILTNDGGVDHTIRHARNIVAMLAVFLHLPQVKLLINFQMAAYRSAYHPVEKLNCILNLSWNGVCLSREHLNDPVLEKSFAGCTSMADARKLAEKHPGLKASVRESINPSIKVLEERARQGSLKGNFFETFQAATDEEVKEFLAIIRTVDDEFDVDEFLDKKRPYQYTPALKMFIEEHVTSTHYAITFQRHRNMSLEFLKEKYPDENWTVPLGPVPCPIVDPLNPDKFLAYEALKELKDKDFDDKCRPGKYLKVPMNIPFPKTKVRAQYGSQLQISCESCGKRRVVYFEHKPSKLEVTTAIQALRNTRYICGGRMSSFGRSLAVLEEISNVQASDQLVGDEVDLSVEVEEPDFVQKEFQGFTSDNLTDVVDDEILMSEDEESVVQKKSGKYVIDSDSDESPEKTIQHDGIHFLSTNQEGSNMLTEELGNDRRGSCETCGNFETGHKCKLCLKRCCNLCNKFPCVEEITDIICPECFVEEAAVELPSKTRGRGRPSKPVKTGQVLIPLQKKKRGRPRKPVSTEDDPVKRSRGRPRKEVKESLDEEIDTFENETMPADKENNMDDGILSELRILGRDNIMSKVFVSEALNCDDPIEAHLFDILVSVGKPLPCFYCGELEQRKLFSLMTEDSFPLCKACQKVGRGAGARRKSRIIKPKPMKMIKPTKPKKKQAKRRQMLID